MVAFSLALAVVLSAGAPPAAGEEAARDAPAVAAVGEQASPPDDGRLFPLAGEPQLGSPRPAKTRLGADDAVRVGIASAALNFGTIALGAQVGLVVAYLRPGEGGIENLGSLLDPILVGGLVGLATAAFVVPLVSAEGLRSRMRGSGYEGSLLPSYLVGVAVAAGMSAAAAALISAYPSRVTYVVAPIACLGVGAVLMTAAQLLVLNWTASPVTVAPLALRRGGGLALAGRF